MGYSGIYRVATCCIIVQATLISVDSASYPNNGSRKPSTTAVDDDIAKHTEEEPGVYEDGNYSYHRTVTASENVNTKDGGKRVQDVECEVNRNRFENKTTKHGDNGLGKQTDISSDSASFTDYDRRSTKNETSGTSALKKTELLQDYRDDTTSTRSVDLDVGRSSTKTLTENRVIDVNKTKKLREQYDDKRDENHIDAHRYRYDKYDNTKEIDKTIQNAYARDARPDGLLAVKRESRMSKTDNHQFTEHTYRTLKVRPGVKTSFGEIEQRMTDTSNDIEKDETNINHETPTYTLHISDTVTQEDSKSKKKWDVETYETDTDKDGVKSTYNKAEGKSKRLTKGHTDRMALEEARKTGNGRPIKVEMETKVLDEDHSEMNEKRETEVKRTTTDGSTKKEDLIEEKAERYDMRKLKPKVGQLKE